MNIIESICTLSDCYKANRKITVKGLMIHSVGTPQPRGQVFVNTWNRPNLNVCPHGVLEATGNVYQTLPWNHRGWHAGGSGNNTHIGVEVTEPSTIRYTSGSNWTEIGDGVNTRQHIIATYNHAVDLFAYLCEMYKLDPIADGVIVSHSEGYKRGIASNHGDMEHIWSRFNLTMNQFRADILNKINGDSIPNVNYRVRVIITALNIRQGPGTNYPIVSVIDPGVYTIIEESDGVGASKWGKLKSGIGWISLDYVTRY